jgi:signal transduction histidine kinase
MSNEMNLSWLLPVLSCVLGVLAWASSMFLFYVLTGRLQKLSAHMAPKEDVASEFGRVREEMRETRALLREIQESRAALMERASEATAVNMNSHGQVLRLHRRGESAAAISSALRVPLGEVNLIVKVYEMTRNFPCVEKR